MVTRLQGWEQGLEALIKAASTWTYELGRRDCFRLACGAVAALTGEDRWPEWEGRYATKREACALLAQYGSSFEDAGDKFFGSPRVSWRLARRGDVVALATSDGEKHLGVVVDHRAVFFGDAGLIWIPLPGVLCAWRIG